MKNQTIEDYLKTIYDLESDSGKVTTNALAEKLNLTPASVTGMIKKLSEKKLVTHKRYQGVSLTNAGRKIALEVIRHHRLIELYLKEALGMSWDKVHEEAEKLEHVISEDIEDRIDEFLGYPKSDPHGSPIPTREGKIDKKVTTSLADLEGGHSAEIYEVSDHDPEFLRYLGDLGFYPRTRIKVLSVEPFGGPMNISVGHETHPIGREAARYISVVDVREIEQ